MIYPVDNFIHCFEQSDPDMKSEISNNKNMQRKNALQVL
jgi:hypothetical protein